MKGQTKELIEILILVIGVSVLLVISYSFLTRTPGAGSLLVETHRYESITDAVKNFFYIRIPIMNKTYAQLLGDLVISDIDGTVDYGYGYGSINVTEIIYGYFDSYYGKNWHFKVLNEKTYNFGYEIPLNVRIRTFSMKFPLPSYEGGVMRIEFKNW